MYKSAEFNHRIATFADLSLAIGKVPKVEFEDLEELISNTKEGYKVIKRIGLNRLSGRLIRN